jgi:hypothetical protein
MTAIANMWGKLPNPPGSAFPFKAWSTMGKVEFDILLTSITEKQLALPALTRNLKMS